MQEGKESDGIIFNRIGSVITSGNQFIVPIMIQEDRLMQPLNKLATATDEWYRVAINQLITTNTHTSQPMDQILSDRVQSMGIYITNKLKQMTDDINLAFDKDSYQHFGIRNKRSGNSRKNKNKRSVVSIIGPLINIANSILTQRRISNIHAHLDTLQTQIDTHDKVIEMMFNDIQLLQNTQARLDLALSSTLEILNGTLQDVSAIQKHVFLLNACDQLFAVLNDIEKYSKFVSQGLLSAYQGKLHNGLVKEQLFISILSDMKKAGHSPLFPNRRDYLALYYDTVQVIPKTLKNGVLMLYLCIPLKGSPSIKYDMFEVLTFPLKVPGTDFYQERILQDKYLVISNNRDHYIRPDFQQCKSLNALYICKAQLMYSTHFAPSCLTQLFLGRDNSVLDCPQKILKEFYPVIRWTADSLIYSTSSQLDVAVYCENKDNGDAMSLVKMSGAGQINKIAGCEMRSAAVIVPAVSASTGRSLVWKSRNMIAKLPSATSDLIQSLDSHDLTGSQELDYAILVHDLRAQKKDHNRPEQPTAWTTPMWLVGVLAAFAAANASVIGYIFWQIYRTKSARKDAQNNTEDNP